ncbi:hypothetical protein P7K49_038893 [Saguinus oedipus]|uniref:Protein kinase domain-containing protein n=1 Tax=Saguinus oedipus TaxID=9490 RepID=A0ABQ9TFY7_SAGOE|nr:hypothetical protein P7K49_038893 [Saguinus oedipus]
MAPEVIDCDEDPRRSYDYRSDVWSVGITAIEMAEGAPLSLSHIPCQLLPECIVAQIYTCPTKRPIPSIFRIFPQISTSLCNLQPLEALFVILRESAPTVKSSGWSRKFHNFMEKCMVKNFLFRPTSANMLHHPFVRDIKNERHVVESLTRHLNGIIKKRQKKEPSRPRWLPDREEPQVQALQQLKGAARLFMPQQALDSAPRPLMGQAQAPLRLQGAARVFRPLQAQVKSKASRPLQMQIKAPPRLQRAARMLMPLQVQGRTPRLLQVQAQLPKKQQTQTQASEPQDLDQVPEEFQGHNQVPEQQRQGQAPEQQQRHNQVPEQELEQNQAPEQPEVQEQAAEPAQAEAEAEEPESLRVHAQLFLPLLSQNHHVLLPLHLDTQVLIPVEGQTEGSPQAQAWTLETPQAIDSVQALIEGLSRDLLRAPNSNSSKPLGPLQTLMENLSLNRFYSQPEQPRKKKSKVSSLRQALAKKLSPKRFRAKSSRKPEELELSDLEARRQRRQHRWEDVFNQHEEELRQVDKALLQTFISLYVVTEENIKAKKIVDNIVKDNEDESSDNDEVFHSIQAEVQIEPLQPCISNPKIIEVQERSPSVPNNQDHANHVKFSSSSVPQPSLLEQAQKPIDIRQRSSQNHQNWPAASESSSEEESPVTGRRSQSSPPYSTIDQKLLVDIHVPDGFKVGKISPPVYLTNEWVGYNALSEIFRNDWLTPAPLNQPHEEDGDYVELYDVGADTDGDDEDETNDAYEDTYDHANGNDDSDNQIDQANDVYEDHDDDNNKSVDDVNDNYHEASRCLRASYGRDGSCKPDDYDGSNGKEEAYRGYGSHRVNSSHEGSAASEDNAATGDQEEHAANISTERRDSGGDGSKGVIQTSEESGALGLNGKENCSETNGPGLKRPASQDFEYLQEGVGAFFMSICCTVLPS